MAEKYGLVKWYLSKFTFDGYDVEGTSREEMIDASSENFFKQMLEKASGADTTSKKSNALLRLKYNDWESEIKPKVENQAIIEWENKVKGLIESSNIKIPEIKNDLQSNYKTYDSEEEIGDDIDSINDYLGGLKERYKGAEDVEERESARRELEREAPNTLRSLKGWESRGVPDAFRYITGD